MVDENLAKGLKGILETLGNARERAVSLYQTAKMILRGPEDDLDIFGRLVDERFDEIVQTHGEDAVFEYINSLDSDSLFYFLCQRKDRFLERVLERGTAPDLDAIVGYEYDGWSTLPLSKIAKMQKFRKSFIKIDDDRYAGYNSRMITNGLYDGWLYMPQKDGSAKRWRIFNLYPAADAQGDCPYPHSVVLDYHTGHNIPVLEETVKDYVVEAREGDPTVLLGKMFNVIMGKHLMPNYFLLRRAEQRSAEAERRVRDKYFPGE